ncbi:MAG: hypothetical protein E5W55_12005 [Mesorhizobium sp.]|nr:MAG: hypothetical protein E5W55_12005 [Mesorhizobium sp.]
MVSRFESLPATATLNEAAQALLRTTKHEFPIVDGGGRLARRADAYGGSSLACSSAAVRRL